MCNTATGVVAHMQHAERAEVIRRRYSPRQILHPMGSFEFAGGHAAALSDLRPLRGVAFASLPYASKVSGLLEDLQLEAPPLGSIGIGQLIARIDRKWDTRDEIRAQIDRRRPELQARAAQTNEFLTALLHEPSGN